jgi:hypothetical protein
VPKKIEGSGVTPVAAAVAVKEHQNMFTAGVR